MEKKEKKHLCPVCNKRLQTEMHHIIHGDEWSKAMSEKYSNACLIFICHKCHEKLHKEISPNKKGKGVRMNYFDTIDCKLKVQAERAFEKYYKLEKFSDVFDMSYDTKEYRIYCRNKNRESKEKEEKVNNG